MTEPRFHRGRPNLDKYEVKWHVRGQAKKGKHRVFKYMGLADHFIDHLRHVYGHRLTKVELYKLKDGHKGKRSRVYLDPPQPLNQERVDVDVFQFKHTVRT